MNNMLLQMISHYSEGGFAAFCCTRPGTNPPFAISYIYMFWVPCQFFPVQYLGQQGFVAHPSEQYVTSPHVRSISSDIVVIFQKSIPLPPYDFCLYLAIPPYYIAFIQGILDPYRCLKITHLSMELSWKILICVFQDQTKLFWLGINLFQGGCN